MSIPYWLLLVGVVLLLPTAYAGKIGAPWVPTHKRALQKALDEIEANEKDVLVDLGAGSGTILAHAARRGVQVVGYELSPIMWAIAKIRLLGKGKVRYANFYKKNLPENTSIVFIFLMPQNMKRVRSYLKRQTFNRGKYLLSYAFPMPEMQPLHVVREKQCAPVYIYDIKEV